MSEGRIIFDGGIKSQPIAAVESLSRYVGREIKDGVLDMGRVKLVLSGDKKSYYAVSATDCSCPAKCWHPEKACKHQRKHYPAKPSGLEGKEQTEQLSPRQELTRHIQAVMDEEDRQLARAFKHGVAGVA
jgi:hypothetical protein